MELVENHEPFHLAYFVHTLSVHQRKVEVMEIRRIAVGVDFSEQSERAAQEALAIARHTGAEITLVHVGAVLRDLGPIAPASVRQWERLLQERAAEDKSRMDELVARLSGKGPEVSQLILDEGPAEGVVKAAEQIDADLVIVGTHGHTGFKRFFLGSVAERVVRLAHRNVLVVRDGDGAKAEGGFKNILVPTDFSPHAEAALRQALALVEPGGSIELVHFWSLPIVPGGGFGESAMVSLPDDHRSGADEAGQRLADKYRNDRCTLHYESVEAGAAHGIIDRANAVEPSYDAIIMGSHGRRGFRRFLLGSVAERAVRHAPCSVLVVHDQPAE